MHDEHTFDFHVHTHLSDADVDQSPEAICAAAKQAGLHALSITDHDHLLPDEQRRALAQQYDLELVPGCEISCVWAPPDSNRRAIVHLGAHWLCSQDDGLRQVVEHNSTQPFDRYTMQMVHNFKKLGLDPTLGRGEEYAYDRLCDLHPQTRHRGKRDVAHYLESVGCVPDRQTAYQMLAYGGPAYVDPLSVLDFVSFEDAMRAITPHALCTLNHLFYSHLDELSNHALLRDFVRLGGQALEVLYPRYDAQQQGILTDFCLQYGLLANCGSDRHDRTRPFLPGPGWMYRRLRRRQEELHGTLNL